MLNKRSFIQTLLPKFTDPLLLHFQGKYQYHALVFLIWGGGGIKIVEGGGNAEYKVLQSDTSSKMHRSCTFAFSGKLQDSYTCICDLGGRRHQNWLVVLEMLKMRSLNQTLHAICIVPVLVHLQGIYWNHTLLLLILQGGKAIKIVGRG